jgi:hydroxypyruvate isomerase
MPQLSANISMLYPDIPFMQRFSAAARSGFSAVEIQFPYAWNAVDIRAQLREHDLELVLFNLPAGDWDAGDRGIAANWARRDEFRAGIQRALEYVDVLQPRAVNLLAGASDDTDENDLALLQNIRLAAEALGEEGVTLVVEPVNTIDVPDFALPRTFAALDVISEIDASNVKLQLDIYHALMMEEDPIMLLQEHIDEIGHIQIADIPGRHQPGTGVVDWKLLFDALDSVAYEGFVGLEYVPDGPTESSFGVLKELGLLH